MIKCAICGENTVRPQRLKDSKLVCPSCFTGIKEGTPFERVCPKGKYWDIDTHQCVPDRVEAPNILESKAAKDLVEKTKQTRTLEYVQGDKAKIKEQIPAQPVVPVGPITVEQKVAALNDKIAKFEQLLANLYGLVGQNYEEAHQALVWKLGKK
jgi:hypothetical protein